MSVKLGRYVFKRIKGRIVPIRVGAEAAAKASADSGLSGISKKAMNRLNLAMRNSEVKVGSTGKLIRNKSSSPTDAMLKFMDKTGAIRFSRSSDSTMIDVSRRMTVEQRDKLAAVTKGEVFVDVNNPIEPHLRGGNFKNFMDAYRKVLKLGPKELKKPNDKLSQKAIKALGTTTNPNEAGYILRDGKMIDLSGKRQGGPSNVRYLDHREVSDLVKTRASKMSDKELSRLILESQRDRKRAASSLHEATSIKRDIEAVKREFAGEDWTAEFMDRMNRRLSIINSSKKAKKK